MNAQRWPQTLVVDDQPDAAHTFAALLRTLGCPATAITDPFLAPAEAENAGLVFLDINMPGLDGLTLARMLRAKHGWQRMHIVAVTAYGSEEHRAATREAGFDAHVVKPVDVHLLESMLYTLYPHMRWSTKPTANP